MYIRFISFIQAMLANYRLTPRMEVIAIATMMTASTASITQAASYIEPDHTTELFQLEKIPLPQHRTQQLGKSLAIIAQRKHDASPENQLQSAKLLLLSMQLDPKNKRPYEINKALSSGKTPPSTPQHRINQCLNEAQGIRRLLSQPKAGAQANQLARLIKDACKATQPNANKDKDEADWKGSLPAITAYKVTAKQAAPALPKNPPPPLPPASKPVTPTPQKQTIAKQSKTQFHLTKQSLLIPAILKNEEADLKAIFSEQPSATAEQSTPSLARVSLKLDPCDPETSKKQFIKLLRASNQTPQISTELKSLIDKKHANIPSTQGHVEFTDIRYSIERQFKLIGPLALMLESSLANRPLRDDLCIIADIDPQGKLIEPDNFWELLTILRSTNDSGRLIVSEQSLEPLEQLLVFKEPDFFTRWEVLSASNIDQALDAAVKKSSVDLQQASEIFTKIQELAINKEVAQLAADYKIRDKLDEMIALAPYHLSASTLLLQGSGSRPIYLSKRTFRIELHPLIKELNSFLQNESGKGNIEELQNKHDELRTQLDKLEPIVERDDKELYQDTVDLASDIKKLASLRQRIARRNNNDSKREKAEELLEEMRDHGDSLIERIMAIDEIDNELEANKAGKNN